ncbi:response regulator [Pseudomonas sp. NPDC086566]|uniref:response regulator n=1 Tax=Pseudomonas sp. NPDC086566 TaxID=3390647 RepID=UPI003D080834
MKNWKFLVVDDNSELADQTADILSSDRTLGAGNSISCDVVNSFDEAKQLVAKTKYDLIVLDLRDDAEKNDLKGAEVLNSLKESNFAPVIFYSGYADKVSRLKTPLVRLVTKGEDEVVDLRRAVQEIFQTGVPQLINYIEEQQRSYLWSHVDEFWKETAPLCQPEELAYLLARRLGNALTGTSVRGYLEQTRGDADLVHPIEMYIWPPMGAGVVTGDLIQFEDKYYVILNPMCDFAQGKIEFIVAAECVPLAECSEFLTLQGSKKSGKTADPKEIGALKALISDNRAGRKVQPDRFKYLPGTVFSNDLVVDFQRIRNFESTGLGESFKRIATLDTPFVESLLSKFSRYYGRIGTPNLDSPKLSSAIYEGMK